MIHTDVKPQNIILRNTLESAAALCDFGTATSGSEFHVREIPCYTAPEFLYSRPGRPSDTWALAITMLVVLGVMPLPNGLWTIAKVHTKTEALGRMVDWLGQVRETSSSSADDEETALRHARGRRGQSSLSRFFVRGLS